MEAMNNLNISTSQNLEIVAEHAETFSLAAQQNAYPLFKRIQLRYPFEKGADTQDSSGKRFENIVVSLMFDSETIAPEEWTVDLVFDETIDER